MRDKKTIQIEVENDLLVLKGNIHFGNVVSAYRHGIELMKSLTTIKVNLKGLLEIDSSALALLTAWVRESRQQKKTITFVDMPNFMRDITRVCGLDGVLPISWEN